MPKKDDKHIVPIESISGWELNARHPASEAEMQRLKNQLTKYGQLDPIVINKQNVILGGHTRLRAMQEMGTKEVWVSVVDAPTEAKMLEYALSDNDRAGYTSDQMLAELIEEVGAENLSLQDYYVKLSEGASLTFLQAQAEKAINSEGTTDSNTNAAKMEAYLNNPNKQIVLFFTDEEYDQFMNQWTEIKSRFDLNDNVSTVKKLLDLENL